MRSDVLWRVTAFAGCIALLLVIFAAGGMATVREGVVWVSKEARTAAVFFVQSTTPEQMRRKYATVQALGPVTGAGITNAPEKVRVLIVPGHQPETGGTEFGAVYERDIVVDIADALATFLKENSYYDVMVSRTKTAWHPTLQTYFDTHALDIQTFKQSQSLQMQNYLADGSILPEADQVYHNAVSSKAALQLYGINKWTSDNGYDMTLHLHINDYAGRRANVVGKYDGFTIYVPNYQYSNAAASYAVSAAIAARLNAYHATSTLPKEDAGIVSDQELIAIGSNNTADTAALLIEYGYIYEPQFREPSVRTVAIRDYAYQTYLGLQDFFKDPVSPTFGSVSFPYDWNAVNAESGTSGPGVYALQAALHHLGYYPPAGASFSDCPVSGRAGSCTRVAIIAYQSAHGLEATGTLGPRTRAALENDTPSP